MATTRSKKAKASSPVEEKQVEAPKAKEVKEAPKPVEKKVEPPKEEAPKAAKAKEAPKPSPKKAEAPKSKSIEIGARVEGRKGVGIIEAIKKDKVSEDEDLIQILGSEGSYFDFRKNIKLA